MTTYTISLNNLSDDSESQYPIILQNYVTPQEYRNIISRCQLFLRKVGRASITFVISITLVILLFTALLFAGTLIPALVIKSLWPYTLFIVLGIIGTFVLSLYLTVFRYKNNIKKGREELRSYLIQENVRIFNARGVEFRLKERFLPGINENHGIPDIEVVFGYQMNNTPMNNMYQQPPTYQPLYQQPTYQQPTYQQQEYQSTPYIEPHVYVSPYSSVQPNQP